MRGTDERLDIVILDWHCFALETALETAWVCNLLHGYIESVAPAAKGKAKHKHLG